MTSISSPSSSSPKTPTSSFMALEETKEKKKLQTTTATATATAAADDHDDDEIKEINEDWLTHGNDAGKRETRESKQRKSTWRAHTPREEEIRNMLVEEASSPSGILSDLHVAAARV